MVETKLEALRRCENVLETAGNASLPTRLEELEWVLSDHLHASWVRAGLALKAIRKEKLYLGNERKPFDKYCRDEWELTPKQAEKLISMAETRLAIGGYTGWNPDTDDEEGGAS